MNDQTKSQKTKARVLDAAMRLINEKGFSTTSVNEIIQTTGVKKGNLYFHFSSKEELGLAILDKAQEEFEAFVYLNLKGQRPLERLSNFFDAVLEKHRESKFVGG